MGRRILSVWFPRLASDAALRRRPVAGAFALWHRAGNADHVHCLNPAAAARGLRRGMTLADARALCPDLVTRPADLPTEAAALRALVRWAGRYSPFVARDGADGIVADISGVAHLFGGEPVLADDLAARLARAGIAAATGIADTRGAAWALARHGGGIALPGATAEALRPLPVGALRIDSDTVARLLRLGLARIGDLMLQPRAPLARRFGPSLVMQLDRATGQSAEPVAPDRDPPHYGIRLTLPEPIGRTEDVMAGLARLLERLCEKLAEHQDGARRLRLELRRVDGETALAEIGLARPLRDAAVMARLFARAVDDIDAGFGIDQLRLTAPLTEPLAPAQIATARAGEADQRLADLITQLGNRLGFDCIARLLPADSHIPERGFLTVPAAFSAPHPAAWPAARPRPVLMFPPEPVFGVADDDPRPPAAFRWRGVDFATARAGGPERIAPEWWFDDPAWRSGLRDYWAVETTQGRRLWLFHTPQAPAWAVQGEFA
jgi:protein ImuB